MSASGASALRAAHGEAGVHPPTPAPVFTRIHMLDASNGWGVAHDQLFRTTDSARTWREVLPAQPPGLQSPIAAGFYGSIDAWVAAWIGHRVVVYRTKDGGTTWSHVTLAVGYNTIPGLFAFSDAQHGWLWLSGGAYAGSSPGSLLATSDGGRHWTVVARAANTRSSALPFGGIKTGLVFANALDGWMTGDEVAAGVSWLYATHDGGHTWVRENAPPIPGGGASVPTSWFGPIMLGSRTELVATVGMKSGGITESVDTSSNGGATWSAGQGVATAGAPYLPISFVDPRDGFMTDGTKVYVTTDGGATWTSFTPNRPLRGVSQLDFVSPTDGFAVVQGGAVFRTTDGGHTWTVP